MSELERRVEQASARGLQRAVRASEDAVIAMGQLRDDMAAVQAWAPVAQAVAAALGHGSEVSVAHDTTVCTFRAARRRRRWHLTVQVQWPNEHGTGNRQLAVDAATPEGLRWLARSFTQLRQALQVPAPPPS